MAIMLPNDVQEKGYIKSSTNQFEFEQVFYSAKYNFTGTEQEFLTANFGYEFRQLTKTRILILDKVNYDKYYENKLKAEKECFNEKKNHIG